MNIALVTSAITDLAYPLIVAAAISVSRALGMIMLTPAFTRLGMTGMIRSAVAFTISVPIILPVADIFAASGQPTSFDLAGLVLKEMVVGALIGLVFGIPFWAAELAGDLVDLQRGSTMSQLLDPSGGSETSVTATLLTITLLSLFFMSGGFMLLLEGFYGSYRLWPATRFTPVLEPGAVYSVLVQLDRIMQIGVLLIAPLVSALLLADIMLALLSRMAPQLHIFDLALAVKNLLFALLLAIYIVFLMPLFFDQLAGLREGTEIMRAISAGESGRDE